MTLSTKWTAVSFLALSAIAAGSIAFAGCTVTSSNVTGDGGPGNPIDDDAGDSAVAASCEGNNQTVSLTPLGAGCQACMDTNCCAELKGCYNLVPEADAAAGGTDNCDKYTVCIPKCQTKLDGTPETDQAKINACYDDCDALTTPAIVTAYNTLYGDGTTPGCLQKKCKTECGQ